MLVAVFLAGFFVVCGPARAASVWLPYESLSSPGSFDSGAAPTVGMDDAGDVAAAWRDHDHMFVAEHPAGAVWGAPQMVSDPAVSATGGRVLVGPAGDVLVSWSVATIQPPVVPVFQTMARRPSGSWEKPETFPLPPPGVTTEGLAIGSFWLAVDGTGSAVGVWSMSTVPGFTQPRVAASVRPPGGPWQPAHFLDDPTQPAAGTELALAPSGEALALWVRGDAPNRVVEAAVRPPGALGFGPPTAISAPGVDSREPRVGMDSSGNALAIWQTPDGFVQATRPAGGAWSSPQGGVPDLLGWLVVGSNGAAVLYAYASVATRPPGGPWGPIQRLSAPGEQLSQSWAGVDARGQTTLVWESQNGNGSVIRAAQAAPGAPFGPPQEVAASGSQIIGANFAQNAAGDGALVWWRDDVRASALKAGPTLLGLSVPAQATVVAPVAVSVSARDAWSALTGPPAWDFGDGGSAVGEQTVHTYTRPGTFTVTVSVTDSSGAKSQLSQPLTVLPPAPTSGGVSAVPMVSAFSARPARFRVRSCIRSSVASGGTALARCRRLPVGTELSYRLSAPAAVRIEVRSVAVRRRVCAAGRCRARTLPSQLVGSLALRGRAGVNRVRVSGRVHGRLLAPGPYSLRLQATRAGRPSASRLVRVSVVS